MLTLLNEISNVTPTKKIKILSENPNLKDVLFYAYNPFKMFNLSPPKMKGSPWGHDLVPFAGINPVSRKLLDQLNSRDLSGNKALEEISFHLTELSEEGAIIFKRILGKDLKIGCGVKTINKAFPGLIPTASAETGSTVKPSFMLCKTFDPDKAIYPLMAAIKKDGTRARAIHKTLQTRAGHRLRGFSHIEEELENYPFEKDGELMVNGHEFDTGSGLIRNFKEVPEAEYWVFDCPSYPGNKLERYHFLKRKIVETDSVKLIRQWILRTPEQLKQFYKLALDQGEEGLVIYTIDHEYRDARSFDWTRLVPIKKADCKVIGFEEGKGKFENSLGKIVVEFDGHKVKVGTGFAQKLWLFLTEPEKKKAVKKYNVLGSEYDSLVRDYIWTHQEEFLGKLALLEYKEKTKAGSMRQPRFKGWRMDKTEPSID